MTAIHHEATPPGKRWSIGHTLTIIVLIVAMIFYLTPVFVMVNNGLKDAQNVSLSTMWNLPENFSGGLC